MLIDQLKGNNLVETFENFLKMITSLEKGNQNRIANGFTFS